MNKRPPSFRARFVSATRARALGALAITSLTSVALDAPAQRRGATPSIVTFDGAHDGARSSVLVHTLGAERPPVRLGELTHAAGSARRGVVARVRGRWSAFVVVAEQSPHAGTYDSALYRVDARGVARLAGGLANGSTPVVTELGDVVVERGTAGVMPTSRGPLREDALEIATVDSETGATRAALRRRGQLAFVGAALRGHEVLVYTIDGASSAVLSLDVATGATRPIAPQVTTPVRDFSYDRASDAIVFARVGAEGYEVATLPATSAVTNVSVALRARSEHLMPLSLGAGRIVFDSPDGRGLASIDATGAVRVLSPLGPGIDRARCAYGDWVAFEHRASRRWTTAHGVYRVTDGATLSVPVSAETDSALLGVLPAGESL